MMDSAVFDVLCYSVQICNERFIPFLLLRYVRVRVLLRIGLQGWGVDVNEEALKKYPPVNDPKTGMWSVTQKSGAPTANPAAGAGHLYQQGKQYSSRL